MLHEILEALLGHTGGIIVLDEESQDISINTKVHFLSESEKKIIKDLAEMGSYYRNLELFITDTSRLSIDIGLKISNPLGHFPYQGEEEEMPSCYLKAVSWGLEEVLTNYREHILCIEQEYLLDRCITLTDLLHKLQPYAIILPTLYKTISDIADEGLKGGRLLNYLFQKAINGNPLIKVVHLRLLWHSHQVFFQQITAWVIHGQLIDYGREFFIHRVEKRAEIATGTNTNLNISQAASTTSLLRVNMGSGIGSNVYNVEKSDIQEWNTTYTLDPGMLPSAYFPAMLSETILFMGKAIQVLQNRRTNEEDRISLADIESISKAFNRLRQLPQFNSILVERVIDRVREFVVGKLYQLVVVKADLLKHLTFIRQFFLLSRGEFWQTFLVEARGILRSQPPTDVETLINTGPFQQAASQLNMEDNPMFKQVRLSLRSYKFEFNKLNSRTGLYLVGSAIFEEPKGVSMRHHCSKTRFSASSAIWHPLKQQTDAGFHSHFTFRAHFPIASAVDRSSMSRGGNISMTNSPKISSLGREYTTPRTSMIWRQSMVLKSAVGHTRESNISGVVQGGESSMEESISKGRISSSGPASISMSFIIQNEKEVNPEKKQAPASISDLRSYLRMTLCTTYPPTGMPGTPLYNQYIPPFTTLSVHLGAPTLTVSKEMKDLLQQEIREKIKEQTEQELFKTEVPGVELVDNLQHVITINYLQGELGITIDNGEEYKGTLPQLQDLIALDNGSGYVGIIHETKGRNSVLDVSSWHFGSKTMEYSLDKWDGLSLRYIPHWPLHLILNPEILESYNKVFRFLLPIRRIQLELQVGWTILMQHQKGSKCRELSRLRSQMSFIVDNLLNYLQFDIIEIQWQQLVKELAESTDFEQVKNKHQLYLINVINKCFLKNTKILRSVQTLLQISNEFIIFLNKLQDRDMLEETYKWSFNENKELKQIENKFRNHIIFLFKILSTFRESQSTPFWHLLLLRIDFNSFLSNLASKT